MSEREGAPEANDGGGTTAPNPNLRPDARAQGGEGVARALDLTQVTSHYDRATIREIDSTVCSLEDNMPLLTKGRVVCRPDYYMVRFSWEAAQHFYLDVDKLRARVLDHQYVRSLYIGLGGMIVHIWRHESLMREMASGGRGTGQRRGPAERPKRARPEEDSGGDNRSGADGGGSGASSSFGPLQPPLKRTRALQGSSLLHELRGRHASPPPGPLKSSSAYAGRAGSTTDLDTFD